MKLYTECGMTIWCGFFGKNADGHHDECLNEVVIEVDDEREEWEPANKYGHPSDEGWRGCVVVKCSKCKSLLEWPQHWTEVDNDEPEKGYE